MNEFELKKPEWSFQEGEDASSYERFVIYLHTVKAIAVPTRIHTPTFLHHAERVKVINSYRISSKVKERKVVTTFNIINNHTNIPQVVFQLIFLET
jgi:hypothetical protein